MGSCRCGRTRSRCKADMACTCKLSLVLAKTQADGQICGSKDDRSSRLSACEAVIKLDASCTAAVSLVLSATPLPHSVHFSPELQAAAPLNSAHAGCVLLVMAKPLVNDVVCCVYVCLPRLARRDI